MSKQKKPVKPISLNGKKRISAIRTILQSRLRRASSLYTREPYFCAQTVYPFSIQESLSDEEHRLSGALVEPPLCKGRGTTFGGGRIVWDTMIHSLAPLLNGKKRISATRTILQSRLRRASSLYTREPYGRARSCYYFTFRERCKGFNGMLTAFVFLAFYERVGFVRADPL